MVRWNIRTILCLRLIKGLFRSSLPGNWPNGLIVLRPLLWKRVASCVCVRARIFSRANIANVQWMSSNIVKKPPQFCRRVTLCLTCTTFYSFSIMSAFMFPHWAQPESVEWSAFAAEEIYCAHSRTKCSLNEMNKSCSCFVDVNFSISFSGFRISFCVCDFFFITFLVGGRLLQCSCTQCGWRFDVMNWTLLNASERFLVLCGRSQRLNSFPTGVWANEVSLDEMHPHKT